MKNFSTFIGMDVHKETIAVVTAGKHGTPRYYGEIANTAEAITKLVKKVVPSRSKAVFCYEAGPCGYGVYRQITDMGHRCDVVAPSLIPKKARVRFRLLFSELNSFTQMSKKMAIRCHREPSTAEFLCLKSAVTGLRLVHYITSSNRKADGSPDFTKLTLKSSIMLF